jgi:hypothetical protein
VSAPPEQPVMTSNVIRNSDLLRCRLSFNLLILLIGSFR